MSRLRIKPSKSSSLMGLVFGVVMIGFGIVISQSIPVFGGIGVIWTLMAIIATVYNAFNLFSDRGLATEVIDVEETDDPDAARNDLASRLEGLKRLRSDEVITEEEYQRKRSEVLKEL